jgi:adenylylsulfate kinase
MIIDPPLMPYSQLLLMTINGEVKFTKRSISKVLSYNRYKKSDVKGRTILLTGLSGSGKTTLSDGLKQKQPSLIIIDGDRARQGISHDLGLNSEDRKEHATRITKISSILNDCGYTVVVALIMPYQSSRDNMRSNIENFLEVFVNCTIEECQRRDPKGLYAKSKSGEIKGMTGIDAPYEIPTNPNIVVNTNIESVDDCVEKILSKI